MLRTKEIGRTRRHIDVFVSSLEFTESHDTSEKVQLLSINFQIFDFAPIQVPWTVTTVSTAIFWSSPGKIWAATLPHPLAAWGALYPLTICPPTEVITCHGSPTLILVAILYPLVSITKCAFSQETFTSWSLNESAKPQPDGKADFEIAAFCSELRRRQFN